jgi:hypothetical protein
MGTACFPIQVAAIANTKRRLQKRPPQQKLGSESGGHHHDNHVELSLMRHAQAKWGQKAPVMGLCWHIMGHKQRSSHTHIHAKFVIFDLLCCVLQLH